MKARTPQGFREKDHAIVSLLLLFREKCAAKQGLHAQQREQVALYIGSRNRNRLTAGSDVAGVSAHHRDLVQRRTLLRPLAGVRGLLLDVDGVFHVSLQPLPGAPELLRDLVAHRVPFRLRTGR